MKISYRRIIYSLILSFCLRWWLFLQGQSYANNPTITLGIYNSYSWTIGFQAGQNIIHYWGNIRTDTTTLWITISATTWSSYSLTWGMNTITWYGSGNYSVNHTINLSHGEWIKNLYGSFLRNTEPYNKNLSIIIDQTAPSQSIIIQPTSNNIVSGNTTLSRTVSTDNGVWLAHYKIHLSLDAGFLWETILLSTWNSIQLWANDLPIGTIFRYVEAVDHLGHSSDSIPSFFHYRTYSIIENNPTSDSGGWWTTPTNSISNNPTNIPHTWWTTTGIVHNTGHIIQWSGSILQDINEQIEDINEEVPPIPIIEKPIVIIEENNISTKENESIQDNTNSIISQEEDRKYTNNSSSNNYIIISNSVDNSSIWLKEYLLINYDILSHTEKWNLVLPNQNQTDINFITSLPRSEIYTWLLYTGAINTGYMEEEIPRFEVITYITQQNNPIYYIIKAVEYWLNIIL